jgi:hypothetical protein
LNKQDGQRVKHTRPSKIHRSPRYQLASAIEIGKAWPNHRRSFGAHSKTAIVDRWPLQLGPSKAFSAQAEEK